jgi:hypothetical protein
MEAPHYFEQIRERAAKRWDQLEADPELAGPWHQLFKQVQSPRHILSELLQNADDARATEAGVRIEEHSFVFTHNGEDFSEEHFASLCRFGYSNKRALHTIGFRGIGFKSTFSLGDVVRLQTPTLSIDFERRRFTEPKWLNGTSVRLDHTEIRVAISDPHREKEVEKNLQEWLKSPVSLLFFKHIRRLRIGEHEMHWGSMGPGPVVGSEWMALHDNPDDAYLLAPSAAEAFPAEALTEIKQERLLGVEQETDFPPCKVEIVLGAKGRLYVVLPTGVETALPFACNAPFIQDPARLKIKDPETSPTNRWLLERVGALAASIMLEWLGNTSASLVERSRAYGLLPDVDRDDNSLEGTCATAVEEAFDGALSERPFLLTDAGEVKPSNQSVILPEVLFDVWPAEQAAALLDGANRPPLSRYVGAGDLAKLVRWGVVERIGKDQILNVLRTKHLPRPATWRRLLKLWAYVAPEITSYRYHAIEESIRIVPVQGKDVLYGASEVVRLGEKRLLQSEADWEFLSEYLLVLNQNWPRFLAEQRRLAEEHKDPAEAGDIDAALAVLRAIALEEASDVGKVIERVAAQFFGQQSRALKTCIQLAQISAKLGAAASVSFRFATKDLHLRSADSPVVFDRDGAVESLFPSAWSAAHLLHPDYTAAYTSCSSEEWLRWVSSGRSGLVDFVPLAQRRINAWGRQQIEGELRRRGSASAPSYPYVTTSFVIEDWDFDDAHWQHWTTLAKKEPDVWARIAGRIVSQPESYWSKAKSARALQVATTGNTRPVTFDALLPSWILKLRDLPCLPDTRGIYRKPADLLRRTLETEPLLDVELFIHGLLDRESTRPLLTLLGVRATPTDPLRLLDCLRALAQSKSPPIHEVEKWYRRLDQMVDTCSTVDLGNIRKAFREEKIIFTEAAGWAAGSGVFLSSDEEDAPGAAIIRASVRELSLWRKVGIADRPTADLAIQWLKQLPSGKVLSQDDARRVRALLARHASRIWVECGHWLNLAREWAPARTLEYALTMQSLAEWSHLHEWVKQKTADLRLPAEITEAPPFSDLSRLAARIEERFHVNPLFPGSPERQSWLNRFGADLCRIELDDQDDTARIRILASDLADTAWRTTPGLEIIPYIDGAPAGIPRPADVVWLNRTLYVDQLPKAKLARLVPDRLGRVFGRPDITAALNYCFGRSAEEVAEYLEENFKLTPRSAISDPVGVDAAAQENETPETGGLPIVDEPSEDASSAEAGQHETESATEPADSEAESAGAGDDDGAQSEFDGVEMVPPKDRHHPKPAKPSIIERFARAEGFQKDGDDRFFHVDGSWLAKANGDRFPWERRRGTGDLVRHYWPKDHCLEREPLQLDADIWGLIEKFPETYALILADPKGDPVEVSGGRLRAMREGGELTLYPATYRLVVNNDRE